MYGFFKGSAVFSFWRKKRSTDQSPPVRENITGGDNGDIGGILPAGGQFVAGDTRMAGIDCGGFGGDPAPLEKEYFADRVCKYGCVYANDSSDF